MVKRMTALGVFRRKVGYRNKTTGRMRLGKRGSRRLRLDRMRPARKLSFAVWRKNPSAGDLRGFDTKRYRKRTSSSRRRTTTSRRR